MPSGFVTPAGGGAQTLAQVLAAGAAAGGVGITGLGATTASTSSGATLTLTQTSASNVNAALSLIGNGGAEVLRISGLGTTLAKVFSGESWRMTVAADDVTNNFNLLDFSETRAYVNLDDVAATEFAVRSRGSQSRRLLSCGYNDSAEVMVGAFSAALVGFYGTAGIAKQTGVAVSAAGIHAALVSLGLIAA